MEPTRPAPAASGQLEKTPIVNLLVYAYERQLTGTLELETAPAPGGAQETASILFGGGQPRKVKTSTPVAYLGRVLLELGIIDQGMHDRSLVTVSQTKRLHGQILLESGAITDEQLDTALRAQILRKLQHVFTFAPETQFRYYDGFDALADFGGDEVVNVDPLPLVWSAVRSAPPWVHISNALTRVTTFQLRLSRKAQIARFGFGKSELDLIELIRVKPMRVADLTATELLKPRETQLLTYCLLVTRQLQVVQDNESAPPPRLDATPTGRPSPVQPARIPNPEQANAMSFALRAATTTIPDTTPRPQRSPVTPTPATPVPPPPPKAPAIAPPPAMGSPSGNMPAATPSVALSPELLARRQEIVARANGIDREDYFQMLEIERTATADQVRDAFFRLAKTWHPDRLPTQLADVREACARIFARISEAHQTLSDAKKREKYMTLLKDGGATPEAQSSIARVVEAATNFQKAEVCMKRNDLAQAEALCRKAHDADPEQPDYLAMLAWLEALKPDKQSPDATRACIAMLDKAIELSENCERAFFYRGMLLKRTGNHQLAVRDFRKSAELNPRNIDAVREVRLYEMRKERGSIPPAGAGSAPPKKDDKEKGKPSGGLFGKLFKK